MKSEPQLFLDCDGVLADFDGAFLKLSNGIPCREYEDTHGTRKFWSLIYKHGSFFRDLDFMEDAVELLDAVAHLNPIILTGTPYGDWAPTQKQEWKDEKIGSHVKMITCLSREKCLHCKPGDILVDDMLKYKHLWEEAGGIFIHHTSTKNTLAELERLGCLK